MANNSFTEGKHRSERHKDHQLPVNKTIKRKKEEYCKTIKVKLGDLHMNEAIQHGLTMTYDHLKCTLVRTERNYAMYRNLELKVGLELVRTSDRITENVKNLDTKNADLAKALGELVKSIKGANAKFKELRASANDLAGCCNDRCNRTQMMLLTGDKYEDCDDKQYPDPGKRPADCGNVKEILHILKTKPTHLCEEVDTILNGAADIIGIQTFSNISSIGLNLLPGVKTGAKDLDDFIVDKVKTGATDITAATKNFSDAVNALVDADFALYNARVDLDVNNGVKDFLCKPNCGCIDECEGGLEECKCDICEICREVSSVYHNNEEAAKIN